MSKSEALEERLRVHEETAGTRALFGALCLYWGIAVEESEDPTSEWDFCFAAPWRRVLVVIIGKPADRQADITMLRSYGNQVIILDQHDLEQLRFCSGGARAGSIIEDWVHSGATHAEMARRHTGILS